MTRSNIENHGFTYPAWTRNNALPGGQFLDAGRLNADLCRCQAANKTITVSKRMFNKPENWRDLGVDERIQLRLKHAESAEGIAFDNPEAEHAWRRRVRILHNAIHCIESSRAPAACGLPLCFPGVLAARAPLRKMPPCPPSASCRRSRPMSCHSPCRMCRR